MSHCSVGWVSIAVPFFIRLVVASAAALSVEVARSPTDVAVPDRRRLPGWASVGQVKALLF